MAQGVTKNPQEPAERELRPLEGSTGTARAPASLCFVVTFWGAKFRTWFCKYAVSSLMAPNNIPALTELGIAANARFLICTTTEDWDALNSDPIFQSMTKLIHVAFLPLPEDKLGRHKYWRMSAGHKILLRRCHELRTVAVYLACDTVFPDGTVREIVRLVREGKHVALCTAVRFAMAGVERELVESGRLVSGRPLTLSKREAVAVGLRNLHPETLAGKWGAENFGNLALEHNWQEFLSCCYWEVSGEEGIIILTHNWAPIFIDFSRIEKYDDTTLENWAIDGDYINRNFGHARIGEEVYVVSDSDSLFLLGLTPEDEMVPIPARTSWWWKHPTIGEWSRGFILNQTAFERYTDPLRRRIYGHRVRWHARDLSPAWADVEQTVDKLALEYLRRDLTSMAGVLASVRRADTALGVVRRWVPGRMLWYLTFLIPRLQIRQFMRPPERQRALQIVRYHARRWLLAGIPLGRAKVKAALSAYFKGYVFRIW